MPDQGKMALVELEGMVTVAEDVLVETVAPMEAMAIQLIADAGQESGVGCCSRIFL